MPWTHLAPPVRNHGSYYGIRVGHKCINFPKSLDDRLYELKWKFINVEFNPDSNQIRFTKGDSSNGYVFRFRRGQLGAKLSNHMPVGRYLCLEEVNGLLFTKQ